MTFRTEVTRWARSALLTGSLSLAVALVVVGTSAASDAGLAPPPGGPDLSRIALSAEDFQSSSLEREGYVRPARDLGFLAEFDREFNRVALGTPSKRLIGLEDDVSLAPNSAAAEQALQSLALGLGLAAGQVRAQLAKQFGVKLAAVQVTPPRRAGAGDDSIAMQVGLHTRKADMAFLLAAVRVGPVVSFFYTAGAPGTHLGPADTRRLATLVVRRTRAGLAPSNSLAPTISGLAQSGESVAANAGTWSNAPALTYQWQECDTTGASCVDLAGATSSTLVLSDADVGHTVRVRVTGTNTYGAATATSAPTAVVAADAPPSPM